MMFFSALGELFLQVTYSPRMTKSNKLQSSELSCAKTSNVNMSSLTCEEVWYLATNLTGTLLQRLKIPRSDLPMLSLYLGHSDGHKNSYHHQTSQCQWQEEVLRIHLQDKDIACIIRKRNSLHRPSCQSSTIALYC